MEKNKTLLAGGICVLIIFLTQFILKAVEVTDFSVQITVTVLILGGILFAIGMIQWKDKCFGMKFNRLTAVFVMIVCILSSINYVLNQCFFEYEKKHLLFTIIINLISWGSVLALIVFLFIAGSITARKNER